MDCRNRGASRKPELPLAPRPGDNPTAVRAAFLAFKRRDLFVEFFNFWMCHLVLPFKIVLIALFWPV